MPRGLWATRGPNLGGFVKLHTQSVPPSLRVSSCLRTVAGLVRAYTTRSATLGALQAATAPVNEAISCARTHADLRLRGDAMLLVLFGSRQPHADSRLIAGILRRKKGSVPLNLPIGPGQFVPQQASSTGQIAEPASRR
jgi:hypothetical protein